MEDEINLGQYFSVLLRWHRLIILAALLAGFAALVVSFMMPPTYEAEAAVAIVKSGTQVSFDPKIKTVSEMDTAQTSGDQTARRKSLTTIASSPDIATAVIAKMGDQLEESERIPVNLAGAIKATSDGDLIKIKASANNAEKAAILANTWTQEYLDRVNALYGESALAPTEIQAQADTAKRDYDQKEAALVAYLANNPIDQLTRQIAEKQQILGGLQAGKDMAVKTLINKEVETRSQIIAQYLTAQAQNRLIAFTKEQEGKNKLLTSYLDAIIASRLAVFNQQSAARIQKLADLYAVDSKMERLLTDARALRSRLTVGASGSSQGNELAGLLLEASAFSTWSNLPVSLQIPIDRLSTGATPAEQLRSLDTLITALEDRRRRVRAEVDTQSQVLLGNSGYEFLDASMFGTDSVMQEVKKKYPELFVIGDLSQLTDNLDTNNPLAKAADERAKALLQLEGLEKVIAYSVTDEPLTKGVNQLHQEVNQLQARVEQENATKQELTRARDLAWSTYTTLSNKVAEASVAAQARGSVVRLAVPAITPQTPVGPRKTVNTLLGLVVGLMLGVGAAFLLEYTDDRISRIEQVTALLKLPMLGAIPQFKYPRARAKVSGNGREDKAILDTHSAAIESFRVLRYNVMANGATWRVLLIASAVPSEGKSTLAANLAALIANLGRSVTLVDGDMRRPSLHKIFDLPNDAGLSDLLSDSPDQIDAHAQATQVEGLRLISSGPLPTDPAALLESQAWTRLIEKLKTTSDVVVIDAPATLGLADTSIMARGADAILMVVERGKSTRRDALRAKEILTATEVPILGVAVNRAEEVPGASTYKYYARPEEGVSPSGDGQRAPEPSGDQARRKRSHGDASQWQMLRDRFVNLIVPR